MEHYADIVAVSSPAAAHVAHGAAGVVAARAPVRLRLPLAAGLGPGWLRPPVTLTLCPPPGQRVPLLHHHRAHAGTRALHMRAGAGAVP